MTKMQELKEIMKQARGHEQYEAFVLNWVSEIVSGDDDIDDLSDMVWLAQALGETYGVILDEI